MLKLKRKDGGCLGTIYVTPDQRWRVWREVHPPRRWFVNDETSDQTEFTEGFETKSEAVKYLANRLELSTR